jgi:hypothetical protein
MKKPGATVSPSNKALAIACRFRLFFDALPSTPQRVIVMSINDLQ